MPADKKTPEGEISRGIVAIYKDYTGRGPDRARTTISDDHATTVIENCLTKAEQTLIENGDGETVRNIRRKFQDAMREDIAALVAEATGRETGPVLSDQHPAIDVAIESVLFAGKPPAE